MNYKGVDLRQGAQRRSPFGNEQGGRTSKASRGASAGAEPENKVGCRVDSQQRSHRAVIRENRAATMHNKQVNKGREARSEPGSREARSVSRTNVWAGTDHPESKAQAFCNLCAKRLALYLEGCSLGTVGKTIDFL